MDTDRVIGELVAKPAFQAGYLFNPYFTPRRKLWKMIMSTVLKLQNIFPAGYHVLFQTNQWRKDEQQ